MIAFLVALVAFAVALSFFSCDFVGVWDEVEVLVVPIGVEVGLVLDLGFGQQAD